MEALCTLGGPGGSATVEVLPAGALRPAAPVKLDLLCQVNPYDVASYRLYSYFLYHSQLISLDFCRRFFVAVMPCKAFMVDCLNGKLRRFAETSCKLR